MSPSNIREVRSSDSNELQRIGALRYTVWQEYGINDKEFPDKVWVDDLDHVGRHWIIENDQKEVIAAARLTFHESMEDSYRDMQLWKKCGHHLPLPTCDLGRLVVRKDYCGRGLAQSLNEIRIVAAREMGAKSIMVTASDGNARLLTKLGFEKIGQTVEFSDRPGVIFHAMQLNLE